MATDCGLNRTLASVLLFTLLCFGIEAQTDQSDYIIQVDSVCPKKPEGKATVKVISDIPSAVPFAYCRHEYNSYAISPTNTGEFELAVSFKGDDAKECVFMKSQSGEIYTIEVYVPMAGDIFTSQDVPHLITCSYEDTGVQESDKTVFTDALKPVEESLYNMGKISKSDVDLYLEDLTNSRVKNGVPLGNTVRLIAELKGSHAGEISFQTVSCRAIGSGNSYSILLAGCGDGIVISKSKGFITKGKKAVSPYFRSFRLRGSRSLLFDCTFAICKKNCDGNSCVNKIRGRRDVRYVRVLTDGTSRVLKTTDVLDMDPSKPYGPIENGTQGGAMHQVWINGIKPVHFGTGHHPSKAHTFHSMGNVPKPRAHQMDSMLFGMDFSMWALLSISMGFTLLTIQIVVVITRRLLLLFQELLTLTTMKAASGQLNVSVIGVCKE